MAQSADPPLQHGSVQLKRTVNRSICRGRAHKEGSTRVHTCAGRRLGSSQANPRGTPMHSIQYLLLSMLPRNSTVAVRDAAQKPFCCCTGCCPETLLLLDRMLLPHLFGLDGHEGDLKGVDVKRQPVAPLFTVHCETEAHIAATPQGEKKERKA